MTDAEKQTDPNLISAVWEEARDLIKRLEGSSVQRFSVQAGDTRIEIERGIPSGIAPLAGAMPAAGPAVSMDGDGAAATDGRHPMSSALVGAPY